MKLNFPIWLQQKKETIEQIANEVPVEIFDDKGNQITPTVILTKHLKRVTLLIPENSRVEVYDSSICHYRPSTKVGLERGSAGSISYFKKIDGKNNRFFYWLRTRDD
jgi:hypothetical protein